MVSINRFAEATQSAYGWFEAKKDIVSVVQEGWEISAGRFKEGKRNDDSLIGADWLVLDFDDGYALSAACEHFKGCRGVIYTTKRHQKPKKDKICDRFRVIVRLSRSVNKQEYAQIYNEYVGIGADKNAGKASQFFWGIEDGAQVIALTGTELLDVSSLLNKIPEGQRNASLTSIAGRAAQLGQDVGAIVHNANQTRCEPPLPDADVEIITKSAERWDNSDRSWAGIADSFNSNKDWAYNEKMGWMHWTGSRWSYSDENIVAAAVIEWATARLAVAISERNKEDEKLYFGIRHGKFSEVVKLLRPRCETSYKLFQDDAWFLNTPNGIVDLKTGTIKAHTRNYGLHQTNIEYNPNADMTTTIKFIESLFPNDTEMHHFMQVYLGYAITGTAQLETFGLMLGSGANGKSTLCNLIDTVMGDYCGVIPTSVLEERTHTGELKPWLVNKVGCRFLFANEPAEGLRINDGIIKELTSKDKLFVRGLYKDAMDISPTWLLCIRANHRPNIRTVDHGTWRRVKELDFTVRFEDNPTFSDTIDKEGFMRWLVEGAMEYARTAKLPHCLTVTTATNKYQQDSDTIRQWMLECTIASPISTIRLSDAYPNYQNWCKRLGHMPFSSKRLAAVFDSIYTKQQSKFASWTGFRLLA